ncbi:MAG: cytochrome c3 family protein [FCB group bacterium]|nr:cytochrome c3 family protein [FCB group bacterium]
MSLIRKIFIIIVFSSSMVWGGQWHIGTSLNCDDCHLQHASKQGQSLPGGPYTYLLLKDNINDLCLSCHDGTNATAPDVQAPVDMYSSTSSQESAAGYFETVGIDNPHGHTLGVNVLVPLQNEGNSVTLTCASCHAVHGNSNYRNLLYDPASVGATITLEEGLDVFTQNNPANPPTVSGSIQAYERDNVGYKNDFSQWCVSCHNQLATNSSSTPPAHFNAHPNNVALNEFVGDYHTDPAHWTLGTGEGFAVDTSSTTGIPRVPFLAPTASDYTTSKIAQSSNKVFCGSCHKAHGKDNNKSLLWPFLEGGNNFIAGCQQCHYK